jgi:hypothetical protein
MSLAMGITKTWRHKLLVRLTFDFDFNISGDSSNDVRCDTSVQASVVVLYVSHCQSLTLCNTCIYGILGYRYTPALIQDIKTCVSSL